MDVPFGKRESTRIPNASFSLYEAIVAVLVEHHVWSANMRPDITTTGRRICLVKPWSAAAMLNHVTTDEKHALYGVLFLDDPVRQLATFYPEL